MRPRRPRAIPFETLRPKVVTALGGSGHPIPIDAAGLAAASPELIKSLPGWIGRFGWLESRGSLVLWCEPRPDAGEAFPSQIILDLSPGRYFVEILDVASGQWISRESAAGGPLVAGLPRLEGPALVLVRPVLASR
jgi:hypothetical protein